MKWEELIYNKMKWEKGQSLIELIIAIGIFVAVVFTLSLFVLNGYFSNRLALELNTAVFLAEEEIEAVRSIRDNSWLDLTTGSHGLAISGDHWVFQGEEENVGGQLNQGVRKISIEDIDPNRKKIISQVSWQFSEGRPEEIKLVTYLTNWQKGIEIRKPTRHNDSAGRTTNDSLAYDLTDGTTYATTRYGLTANPSITFDRWELPTQTYTSLVLKYRYHAEGATNDRYAVAYSNRGCSGTFTDLISRTSAAAEDTTISVSLPSNQNLSRLCLKIYTQRIGSDDGKRLFTRDIWTEGTYY